MKKALFVDFYGTLVHEDGEIIKEITNIIHDTGNGAAPSEIDSFWWKDFQNMFVSSFGDSFELQRDIERKALAHTTGKFESAADASALCDRLFSQWSRPEIFEDTKEFFDRSPLPIYIVSNIDNIDIRSAIEYHGLKPAGVFTSEDARSYKPRKELFELALSKTGLDPEEVIHIGDSVSSDVKGASALGIRTLWLNRFGKEVPSGVTSISTLLEVFMNLDVTIRKATLDDLPALRDLYLALEEDGVRYQPEHFVIGERTDEFFQSIFDSDTQDILVADIGGEAVGFVHVMILQQKTVSCLKPQSVVYMQDLCVREDLRSKGIGSILVKEAKKYGKEKGVDFIRTQVFPGNVDGMRFYERNGFCEMMKTIECQSLD